MDKPDFVMELRDKDVFGGRVEYEFKSLQPDLDSFQQEQVMNIANASYMEGYLDGLRFAAYLYECIT